MLGIKISFLEAVALIGLGIMIENPEKRKFVIGTLDNTATAIGKTIKDFTTQKGGAANVQTSAEPEISESE